VVDGGGLENVSDRLYQDGYIFADNFTSTCAKSGQILAILRILERTPITDPSNFALKLLV
jgi:hypothetical protein